MATKIYSSPHILPKQMAALVTMLILIFLIGFVGFTSSEGATPTGAAVLTIQSLGFQNHAELSDSGKVLNTFLSVFGVIIIWFAIWTAFGLAVEGKFGEYFKEIKMAGAISTLRDHYIVCGAGRVGKHVGARLRQRGEEVLFLEKDRDIIDKLLAEGFLVLETGSIDDHIMGKANIKFAKGVVATLGDDSKNLLLIMTAKELNPGIRIGARINDTKLIRKFRHAGADFVILPEAIGGVKLADALLGNVSHEVIWR
ncbi:MAG: NAD-binding protein [DPANN group archaeon]|nr:NAD-binding protein [DPANN group archaeon]